MTDLFLSFCILNTITHQESLELSLSFSYTQIVSIVFILTAVFYILHKSFMFQLIYEDNDIGELALKCLSLLVQLFGGESPQAMSTGNMVSDLLIRMWVGIGEEVCVEWGGVVWDKVEFISWLMCPDAEGFEGTGDTQHMSVSPLSGW